MANSEDVQRDEERRTLIRLALGKASVAFMRQSAEVVMPTEELLEVSEDIHAVWALEVDNLAAEVRELRRDRARLDWLADCGCVLMWQDRDQEYLVVDAATRAVVARTKTSREAIDAAMGGED